MAGTGDPNNIVSSDYEKVFINSFATRANGVEPTMYGATVKVAC